jgi:hypothetical protein
MTIAAMTSAAIWASFVAFFVLALVSPLLPLFLMWRTAALSALFFTSFQLLQGSVHWSDRDAGHDIGIALLTVFAMAVVAALFVRTCIAAYCGWLTAEILIAENTGWIDGILLVVVGAVGGLVSTATLALLLGGSSGGTILDLAIGLAASALVVLMAFKRAHVLALPVTSLSLVVTTISFIGSEQTRRIVDGATIIAAGRPWCISVPKWRYDGPTISDLGFYSLPKGTVLPHLVLVVHNGSSDIKANWSIRRQRFESGATTIDTPCTPTAGI